ncbi:MAG: phosphoglucomutase [Limnochordales bacterium]|nr:phosphoglucomutase [Limnochordales bacterium]
MGFVPKLNRRTTPYVIYDEVLTLKDGVGEAQFAHDNVRAESIEVWTGPGKTGVRLFTYTLREVPDQPWKTIIRVTAPVDRVYLTYETTGDQVEADDVNMLQTLLEELQQALAAHERDSSSHIADFRVDGGTFV